MPTLIGIKTMAKQMGVEGMRRWGTDIKVLQSPWQL